MYKVITIIALFFINNLPGFAQQEHINVGVYYHPNATDEMTEKEEGEIKDCLSDFFLSLQPGYDRSPTIDRADFGFNYGFINQAQYSYAYKSSTHFKPGISFVKKIDDDTFEVKISFISATENPVLKFIHALLLKRMPDGLLSVFSTFERNTEIWNIKTVGNITYTYEESSAFDQQRASAMYDFSRQLATLFNCEPIAISYYKFKNPTDLFQNIGVDYITNQFFAETGGFAIQSKKMILAANNSEYYPHELCHIYTYHNQTTGQLNSHADEGFATYMGGSGALSLHEILRYVEQVFLTEDKDAFIEFKDLHNRMPNDINFAYGISGLFIVKLHQEHGFEAVKELLYSNDTLEAYLAVLTKHLHITETNFDGQVRKLLKEYNRRNNN
ncbi:MAG TPA: hypothetical protein PKA53_12645 [Sphingobacterium sp.]|nr:hypothetical protein [Sphingobacterium sp.]